MEVNYKEECLMFDEFLKLNNFDTINISNANKYVCNYLSNMFIPNLEPNNFDIDKKNETFIKSINELGKETQEYYKEILPSVKIVRTNHFENGYAEIIGNSKNQKIYLTKNQFKDIDFIAFSHELGHLPYLRVGGRKEFYEYSEILSIFFEYLSCLKIYGDEAYNNFLKIRLNIAKEEALAFLEANKQDFYEDNYHFFYLENEKRDHIKYVISLDYVLNLIDIYNTDRKTITDLIDSVVVGYSSFKEETKKLNIDNDCKKLVKVINKL